MSEYRPDRWAIVKFEAPNQNTFYKIIAGWNGSYASPDTWKLSSALETFTLREASGDLDKMYEFDMASGSKYICDPDRSGFTGLSASILESLQKQAVERELDLTIVPIFKDDDVQAFLKEFATC